MTAHNSLLLLAISTIASVSCLPQQTAGTPGIMLVVEGDVYRFSHSGYEKVPGEARRVSGAGSIKGRLVKADGRPVANVRLQLLSFRQISPGVTELGVIDLEGVRTAAGGEFMFRGLGAGDYVIKHANESLRGLGLHQAGSKLVIRVREGATVSLGDVTVN